MRVVVVALALACAAPAVAEPMDTVYAVVPLDGLGVDAVLLDNLDHALRDEVTTLGFHMLTKDAVAALKQDCGGDAACLVKLGKDLHADRVVAGSVGLAGDEVHIALRTLDVALEPHELHTVDAAGPADQSARSMRGAVLKLLAPDKFVTSGAIAVSTSLEGAEIWVDGMKRGTTPMFGPVDALSPGRREVEVRYPGKTAWRGFLDVSFDEPARLDVAEKDGAIVQVAHSDVKASTKPRDFPVLALVGAGVGVVSVLAFVGAALEYQAAADAKRDFDLAPSAEARDRNQSAGLLYGILVGAGLVGLGAGGGLAVYGALAE